MIPSGLPDCTVRSHQHHRCIQWRGWRTSEPRCRWGTYRIPRNTTGCCRSPGLRFSVCTVWWMSSGAFVPGRSRSFHLECRIQLCSRSSWGWNPSSRPIYDGLWSNRRQKLPRVRLENVAMLMFTRLYSDTKPENYKSFRSGESNWVHLVSHAYLSRKCLLMY